jgi:Tfp pilus assembly protein PilO
MSARLALEIWTERSGPSAVRVLAVLCVGTLVAIGLGIHQLSVQAQLHRELARSGTASGSVVSLARSEQAKRLQAFQSVLGSREEMDTYVARVHTLATTYGLRLERSEYQFSEHPGGGYDRYEISVPAVGESEALQTFALALLKEFPFIAVHELAMRREESSERVSKARLKLSVFVRRVGAPSVRGDK